MPIKHQYTIEEDISLAEALLQHRLIFTGRGMKKLNKRLPGVYKCFLRGTARFGIDGSLRSPRSVEGRAYLLLQSARDGQLNRNKDMSNPLAKRREELLSAVFGMKQVSGNKELAPVQAHTVQECVRMEDRDCVSIDRKSAIMRGPVHGRIQKHKQKALDISGLLNVFFSVQKLRIEMKLKMAENMRRRQEIYQAEHKGNIEVFHTILTASQDEDDAECVDLLNAWKETAEGEVRLCMMYEENLRDRLENDHENYEWEKSTFQELMKMHFD